MSDENSVKKIILFFIELLPIIKCDAALDYIVRSYVEVKYRKMGTNINFISQGFGTLRIEGELKNFSICKTSHLKSNTYIQCDGGVKIGSYFHVGRNLTIFSSNHNIYRPTRVPYDDDDNFAPVHIKDFVWIGANVTILPGVTIGKCAVVGAGSVVSRDVPEYSIVAGNPARVIGSRDKQALETLINKGMYF